MVHPNYRNSGIFTELFLRARKGCTQIKMSKMILICEKSSETGKKYLNSIGANHYSTEYKMKLNIDEMPMLNQSDIKLRKATVCDTAARASIIK